MPHFSREDVEPRGDLLATMASYRAMKKWRWGLSGHSAPRPPHPPAHPPPPPRHRTGSAGSCRGRGSPESDHEEAAGLQGAFSRNGVCCRDYGSTERLAGWARCVHQVTGMLGVCSTTRQEHIPSQGRTRGRLSREPPCLQMQWILP